MIFRTNYTLLIENLIPVQVGSISCLGFENYNLVERDNNNDYFFYGVNLKKLQPSFVYSDCVLFPSVLKEYKEYLKNGLEYGFFSFNVTMQGHPSYDEESMLYEPLYSGTQFSDGAYYAINNYLGSELDTQKHMMAFLEELEELPATVVIFYGDHGAKFAGNSYTNLQSIFGTGIEGHKKQYSTEYLIWANSAAKAITNNSFSGEGPTISANYLFTVLFQQLGWEGNGYSIYLREMMETLPVITSNGYYVENGKETFSLTENGERKLNEYLCLQYYLHHFVNRN